MKVVNFNGIKRQEIQELESKIDFERIVNKGNTSNLFLKKI